MNKEQQKEADKNAAPKIYSRNAFQFEIKHCPGYVGYIPSNLNHEVCKYCGSIKYYH